MNTHKAAIALVAVLALTLCGSVMILPGDSDAATGQAFQVDMGAGDFFTYTPTVPGTVSIESGSASVFLSVVDGTVKGVLPRSGSYQAALQINDNGKTTTQIIDFKVAASTTTTGSPSVTDIKASSLTGDLHNLVLTITVSDAKTIEIDWGDSSNVLSTDVRSMSTHRYSAMHNYSGSNAIVVGLDVSNSSGVTHAAVLLDLGNAVPAYANAVDDAKTFLEDNKWFVAFLILTIILIVAFAFIRNPLILIPAIILAVLAALSYKYGDPAGIIDGLKGLLGL